jgi:hypothetical protein
MFVSIMALVLLTALTNKDGKVMPYYKNSLKASYNSYQEIDGNGAGLKVKFNNGLISSFAGTKESTKSLLS